MVSFSSKYGIFLKVSLNFFISGEPFQKCETAPDEFETADRLQQGMIHFLPLDPLTDARSP